MRLPWEGKHDYARSIPKPEQKNVVHEPINWRTNSTTPKEPLKKVKRPRAASGKTLASKNGDIKVINLVTGEVTVEKNKVTGPRNRKGSR